MNFIGTVTIAASGKLQEFSIPMETPSLTAASAGSTANVVFEVSSIPRVDFAATTTAAPLKMRQASGQTEVACWFQHALPDAHPHLPTSPSETVLLRNGRRYAGVSRRQMNLAGGSHPHRRTGLARRFSATAVG